ncbi:MAG: AIR synthase-related protein, partial [Alphaproteobacteria bacterium]|nr:AIR synthase-related protein [Alphaproteobacteria bacterium]
VLPAGLMARLNGSAWPRPALFEWLQGEGAVPLDDMYRTFNMGVGMVLVADSAGAGKILDAMATHGIEAWQIGEIGERQGNEPQVVIG